MSSYKDAPSIMQDDKACYFTGSTVALERHHIFGAANRKQSAKYGLWVWLRHDLHNEPPEGVHFNRARRECLQMAGQRAFMEHYPDLDFVQIFGKNYL